MSEEVEIASKKLWDLFYSTIDSNGKYREIDKEVFIAAMVSTLKQYYYEGFEAAERSFDSMRAALVEARCWIQREMSPASAGAKCETSYDAEKLIKSALTPEAAVKAREKDGGV